MLTAASMESYAHSSKSAMGVTVDVIATARLSNSQSVGADADYFVITEDYYITTTDDNDGRQQKQQQNNNNGMR